MLYQLARVHQLPTDGWPDRQTDGQTTTITTAQPLLKYGRLKTIIAVKMFLPLIEVLYMHCFHIKSIVYSREKKTVRISPTLKIVKCIDVFVLFRCFIDNVRYWTI